MAQGSGRPILIVEDDRSIRLALEMTLTAYGYPVALASDGRQALDRVEEQRPSLVFLDMNLPVMDGWEFDRELHARGFDPPVLIMTTIDRAPGIATELGAVGFLGKPFNLTDLLALVRLHRVP